MGGDWASVGVVTSVDEEEHTQQRLWWTLQSLDPSQRIEGYFSYLEVFPLGTHNRTAAEAIEGHAATLPDDERVRLLDRLRALRDPLLPELEPDTMD